MTQYTAPIEPSATYPQNPAVGDTFIDSSTGVSYSYTANGWVVASTAEGDVDWFGERHNEKYLFRRVSWDAWQYDIAHGTTTPDEIGELTNITGGGVSLSALNDLKATCEFTFEGGEPPNPNELVRIYYVFTDKNGRTLNPNATKDRNKPAVLGTFFPTYNGISYEEDFSGTTGDRKLKLSGSVSGDSVISVLLNKRLGMPYTLPAGTPTLQYADQLIKSLGIKTNNPAYIEQGASSPSVTKWAHTFEPDDPMITVVNWCLRNTEPRYHHLTVDPYGVVQIVKYTDVENTPSPDSIEQVFTTDQYSIVQRGITSDNDWQTTPNVCRICFSNDEISLWAVSKNVTGSRFSLDARGGREITVQGDIEELAGNDAQAMLARIMERCEYRLKENSSEIEHTVFTHAYLGWLRTNMPVALDYVDMWTGYITNLDINLSPSTQCTTKIRRFLPNSIVYETTGGILWTA